MVVRSKSKAKQAASSGGRTKGGGDLSIDFDAPDDGEAGVLLNLGEDLPWSDAPPPPTRPPRAETPASAPRARDPEPPLAPTPDAQGGVEPEPSDPDPAPTQTVDEARPTPDAGLLPEPPGTPIIQLFHVCKRYTREAWALDDLSLRIDKGEFVLLTGPSGAGKTTLLKLVFCAERPSQGQLLVAGHSVHRIRRGSIPYLRRNIGVVFQDFKLLNDRTVFDNVAFALEVLGRPRRDIRRRVEGVLRRVALADKAHLSPHRLSGGEQQRVAIARALVNEPAILLADEPTGNLDPALSAEVMALLEEVNVRGTTVVVATHDPTLLRRGRKRVITLVRGRLTEDRR